MPARRQRSYLHGLFAFARSRKVNPLLWALLVQGMLILATLWILVFRAPPEEVRFLPVQTPGANARPLPRQSLLAQMARESSAVALHDLAADKAVLPAPLQGDIFPSAAATPSLELFSPFTDLHSNDTFLAATPAAAHSGTFITEALSASEQVTFFGIAEKAQRYVILLDTSNSMFVRSRAGIRYFYDFSAVKEETARLLDSLNANTLFNVIVYEGGAWAWQEHMQVASLPVREQAQQWVRNLGENPSLSIADRRGEGPLLREGGGTRLDTALKLAFQHYQPEVIFIVTDGEINSIPGGRITEETIIELIRSLQAQQTHPARIHVVHFQTAQMREVELQTLRAIAREGKGRFTQVLAAER